MKPNRCSDCGKRPSYYACNTKKVEGWRCSKCKEDYYLKSYSELDHLQHDEAQAYLLYIWNQCNDEWVSCDVALPDDVITKQELGRSYGFDVAFTYRKFGNEDEILQGSGIAVFGELEREFLLTSQTDFFTDNLLIKFTHWTDRRELPELPKESK